MARDFQTHIIAGSHPVLKDDGSLLNESMLFRPDGTFVSQPKLHITPWEKSCLFPIVRTIGSVHAMRLRIRP